MATTLEQTTVKVTEAATRVTVESEARVDREKMLSMVTERLAQIDSSISGLSQSVEEVRLTLRSTRSARDRYRERMQQRARGANEANEANG